MSRQSHRVVPRPTFARLVAAFVGALSMLATLVAVDTVNPAGAAVAKTFYVAPTGNNSAAGTAAAPYRTIKKAVARASSGDTIVLRDGVYRESVYIYGKAIKLESAQGERAVMEGARAVGGFRSSGGDWIRNNILGLGRDGSPALFNVDDWTEERSADQMNVTSDYNAFWLPDASPTKNVSRWARWPQSLAYGSTLASHRRLTGQDAHSIWSRAVTNPYVRNAASGDYRAPVGAPIGAPVKAAMAWQVGVPSGTQLPIGPVAPVTIATQTVFS